VLKKLTIKSLAELDELINTFELEEGSTYDLDAEVPFTQNALVRLSESALGQNLEKLNMNPEYNDVNPPVIDTSEVKFPKLKGFEAKHQGIQSIHFTADCFPLLESVTIEQPCCVHPDAFNTDLPNLQSMGFEFVTIKDTSNFGPSLSRSPKLKYFAGYKLWGLGEKAVHRLILPNVTYLNLYRSDDLRGLKLWAPKLEELNLQACYSIAKVDLMTRKPAGFTGPEYAVVGTPSDFSVNCINAEVPKGTLVSNKRCRKVWLPDDDQWAALGNRGF